MNPAIVQAVFLHLVIPELARALARRSAPPETKDEIVAEMNRLATTYLNAGEDFLRQHGALPPA